MRALFVVVFVGFGLACGTSEVAPPEPAPVVDPEPVAPEPAPVAAPEPGAPLGVGHCTTAEVAQYDCPVAGDKRISLCSNADITWMQYRFGKVGAPELVHPVNGAPSAFEAGHVAWARGEEHSVAFRIDDVLYKVVDASCSGIDGEANNYTGVKVFKGDEELAFVECTEWPRDSRIPALGDVLAR